jgi:translation elongation factor EF-4
MVVLKVDSPSQLPELRRLKSCGAIVKLKALPKRVHRRNYQLANSEVAVLRKQIILVRDARDDVGPSPLAEIVYDFYDQLKGISKGYRRWIYELIALRPLTL